MGGCPGGSGGAGGGGGEDDREDDITTDVKNHVLKTHPIIRSKKTEARLQRLGTQAPK